MAPVLVARMPVVKVDVLVFPAEKLNPIFALPSHPSVNPIMRPPKRLVVLGKGRASAGLLTGTAGTAFDDSADLAPATRMCLLCPAFIVMVPAYAVSIL